MSFWNKLFGGSLAPATQQPLSKPTAPSSSKVAPTKPPKTIVEEVKDMLRKASGAQDFVAKANRFGFRAAKEDFMGLWLEKGDCTLILAVLPSHGSDLIWCLSMIESKDAEIVNLVNEGKLTF
jgi:hypothetical protein